MAEAKEEEPTFPQKGKVQAVRKQWAVHEDGALAYQIQNEEIDQHYGLNRFNRRMVREDIPVAKIVQSEEEIIRQQERLRELAALKAMAEEDEKVAKRIEEQLKHEAVRSDSNAALDDEELARLMQEKEKKRYERHLERKREKKLKQERQQLEAQLAKDTEEARLRLNSDAGSERLGESTENLSAHGDGVTRYRSRVTPSGRIEDDGDFSDFYNLPDEMDEFTRLEIQASQDEELARLLQEQEHKRSKAEVNQDKLRRIEQQDEQLARVMQEQEKLRLKKAKLRHQQKKEAQRKQAAESMPLGASANTFYLQQISDSPPPSTANSSSGHNRYRRNSYTQAFDSPPSPPHTQPPARSSGKSNHEQPQNSRDTSGQSTSAPGSVHSQQYSKAQQHMAPPLVSPMSSPRSAYIGPGAGGMSTLESARRIAAGDHERIQALQNSSVQQQLNVVPTKTTALQERSLASGTANTMDIIRAHSHQNNSSHNGSRGAGDARSHPASAGKVSPDVYTRGPHHGVQSGMELRGSESAEVLQWLSTQEEEDESLRRQQLGRSGSGSYYTDEEENPPHVSYPNGSTGFNIAAAIDPTYQRRHPEAALREEAQRLKSHVPFSLSLPQSDGELEWDPGLRGSLRKTKAPIHGYQDSSGRSSHPKVIMSGSDPAPSVWQPVQGQRRGEVKSRAKAKKQNSAGSDKKDKSNCKQQ